MSGALLPGAAAHAMALLTPEPERPLPTDPVEWMRDELREHPWSKQREIIRSVVENRRTAVPSAHETGKSYIAARCAAYWIASAPIGTRFVVSSAPSTNQVKGIVWRELQRAHFNGGLPGTISIPAGEGGMATWTAGGELVGWGRKPQDLSDPNQAMQAFQGIHAPNGVLVILDEATGIDPWLWAAANSLLGNDSSRILAIGNPDDPSSAFAERCAPGSGWNVIPISAFDTPAFTGEVVPQIVLDGLVSRTWVQEAEQEYGGVDNPLYQSKVLGQFPDRSDTLVISPHLIRKAQQRDMPGLGRGSFGLDVARSPRGDHSALYRNRDGVIRLVDTWRGLPITAHDGQDGTVQRTLRHVKPTPAVPVVVDVDGLGAGAYDGLRAAGVSAVPFSASGAARRSNRFDSRRSELWWGAREALERGEWDLDPEDDKLAAQLMQPRWWLNGRGRIHVESKDEMSSRGLSSPDRADAVIMADQGAPMELRERGDLGEYPAPPERPKADPRTHARPGEGARLRHRPM